MAKIISLADTTDLVNAVVDMVFTETDGVMEYYPEYLDVTKAYYKVFFLAPEEIGGMTIFDFYEDYINGKFNEILVNDVDIRQNEYIDKAIDEKIEFKKNQLTNPLTNSFVRFIDNVSNIAETQLKNFDGVDTNKLLDGISAMGEKFDMKEAVDMLVNTKYPADDKATKKKSTRKTKAVKLDTKEAE